MEKQKSVSLRHKKEQEPIHAWVIRIIKSCKTPLQMELCEKLVENYTQKFKDNHIASINEVFHFKSLKTNYYQHKEVKHKEQHKLIIPNNHSEKQ